VVGGGVSVCVCVWVCVFGWVFAVFEVMNSSLHEEKCARNFYKCMCDVLYHYIAL